MKFIFLLIILISTNAFSKDLFHVEVETNHGLHEYTVNAPSDSMALDSVLIGAIYNKRLGKPLRAKVKETGLSTQDLPQREFIVKTDKKTYRLYANVANPEYAMTAIQASKYLMSNTTAREVQSPFTESTLKSRPAKKYTVKYVSKEVSYLLNTNNPEDGRIALDIAAVVSERANDYLMTYTAHFNCVSIFRY